MKNLENLFSKTNSRSWLVDYPAELHTFLHQKTVACVELPCDTRYVDTTEWSRDTLFISAGIVFFSLTALGFKPTTFQSVTCTDFSKGKCLNREAWPNGTFCCLSIYINHPRPPQRPPPMCFFFQSQAKLAEPHITPKRCSQPEPRTWVYLQPSNSSLSS